MLLFEVIRTTFWTRFDRTVRSDELKERIEVRNIDAKEEAKRNENEVASSTASTTWIKDHDEIQFQHTGWYTEHSFCISYLGTSDTDARATIHACARVCTSDCF